MRARRARRAKGRKERYQFSAVVGDDHLRDNGLLLWEKKVRDRKRNPIKGSIKNQKKKNLTCKKSET